MGDDIRTLPVLGEDGGPVREFAGARWAGSTAPAVSLTPRETEVLLYLSTGNSNKAIAGKLGIAEGTVKVHMKSITRKLGVANRTEAAIWALYHGRNDAIAVDHR